MAPRVVASKGKEEAKKAKKEGGVKELKETKRAQAADQPELSWDAVHESLEELSDTEKLAHCFKVWKEKMPALRYAKEQEKQKEEEEKRGKGKAGGKYAPESNKGKRFSLQDKRAVEELMIKEAFKEKDKERKSVLQRDELRQLMQEINHGIAPDDYEVEFIFRTAHCEKDEIDERGVLHGVKVWRTQTDIKEDVDRIFDRYDEDQTGKLDQGKMKRLLVELNDGEDVPDADVVQVIENASVVKHRDSVVGVITKIECMSAVAAWYAHLEEKEKKRKGLKGLVSRLCTVM